MITKEWFLSHKSPRLGKKHSEETKKRMHDTHMGHKQTEETKNKIRQKMIGRTKTQEQIEKWKKSMIGCKHSEESNRRKSEIMRKRMQNEFYRMKLINSLVGHKVSEETKIKIGRRHKGKKYGEETRRKIRLARLSQVMPIKDTKPEKKMQQILSELGIKFETHRVIGNITHKYQCDVFIPKENIVIEVDGLYWHKYPQGREIDHTRTKEMQDAGYKVLRFWENEINEKNVLERLGMYALELEMI